MQIPLWRREVCIHSCCFFTILTKRTVLFLKATYLANLSKMTIYSSVQYASITTPRKFQTASRLERTLYKKHSRTIAYRTVLQVIQTNLLEHHSNHTSMYTSIYNKQKVHGRSI